jgi:predicted negative regulator of RcsB-dependent stress response
MRRIAFVLFALFVLGLAACSSSSSSPPSSGSGKVTQIADPDPNEGQIDQALLVALSQAKNFHHEAKVYMTDGNLPDAIAAVQRILGITFPAGAPEAEDVRLDARALLAKLQVLQGKVDDAMKTVDDGIASATRESFFLANLYTVKGEVLEARAANLEGDAAKADRRAAIAAYDRSLQIDETLQKQLVGESP